jgi:radical SAM protein with 4Fe4S-binding SPASM domain
MTPSQRGLHAPAYETLQQDGLRVLIDPSTPNWIATDEAGVQVLSLFNGQRTLDEVVSDYARSSGHEIAKAWQHVDTIAGDAIRHAFLSEQLSVAPAYAGRAAHLSGRPLSELWIHTNNSCNLACSHCLVSSGPDGDRGLPTEKLFDLIAQARALGTRHFFFTGGEPFLRKDILDLIDRVLSDPAAALAILTNGLCFTPTRLVQLAPYPPERLRLQISLDGSTPTINDPIRGEGSYKKIIDGIRSAVQSGLSVTVSTAITETNVEDVSEITRLIATLGVRTHHLLWLHKRGRAGEVAGVLDRAIDRTPPVADVIAAVRLARTVGAEVGVVIDNHEAVKNRLRYPVGTKRDLASAGVSSLCVYSDGWVYPSAAMADIPDLRCGSVLHQKLEDIWRDSPVSRTFRAATVAQKPICSRCPIQFFCGGGDVEHSYFYGGSIAAHDPYCDLHQAMFADAFFDLAAARQINRASGFNAPVVLTGMGESAIHCADAAEPQEVITSRSECVLTFDLDAPRKMVRAFYGAAAETPSAELCCPIQPDANDLSHIPPEVVERFYGCGSPVGQAGIRAGETTLDLGSGAGIDVFIAAKKVGPTGRAIGVDMTPQMLAVAREAQPKVAERLGYDAVEFRHGFLEAIPVDSKSVDLVTSNCVINLSPDKRQVFSEIWRVLKDHGRVVVADIVADREVPPHQRKDPRLWGECISGALTEEAFLADLERAGFFGIQVITKTFWKEVEGYRFFSITVRGYKFEKTAGCIYIGQTATYLGPFKGVSDQEGHWFPLNVAVEICTDTAAKLTHPPYLGHFRLTAADDTVTDGTTDATAAASACDPTAGCC